MTYTLAHIDKEMQPVFIWFVMLYPIILVILFFFTMYTRPAVLFSPSDYEKDTSYLSSISQKKGMDELSTQLAELSERNVTSTKYLETLVQKLLPEKSSEIISTEKQRLEGAHYLNQLEKIGLIQFLTSELELSVGTAETLVAEASDVAELPDKVFAQSGSKTKRDRTFRLVTNFPKTRMDFLAAKQLIERNR